MRSNKIEPVPATDESEQNASSPKVSSLPDPSSKHLSLTVPPSSRSLVLPDSSYARGPAFPGPSSARGLVDPSSSRGPVDPFSARGPAFPGPSSARGPAFPGPSSARGSIDPFSARSPAFPGPSSARGSIDPSSSRGPVDPFSARGPAFPGPSSARDPAFPGPSSARDSTFLDPSSTSGSPFPDPSAPKGSRLPDSSPPKGLSFQDSSASLLSDSSKSLLSPGRSTLKNIEPSSDSLGQSVSFADSSFQKKPTKKTGSILKIRPRTTPVKESEQDDETTNWLCAAIALLPICLLLLAMVCLMSVKVHALEEESEARIDIMMLKVLALSETLRNLQMGKAWSCTMCPVQWVQQAELCFFFSELRKTWLSSKHSCMGEFSSLAVVDTKKEMEFLENESGRYYSMRRGKTFHNRFWLGVMYDNSTTVKLKDGTQIKITVSSDSGPNPCVYLQNGKLYTKPCDYSYYYICKRNVEFGWY